MLRAIWKALTSPRTDPSALACPVCGWHRFKVLAYPLGYLQCKFCDEEYPDTELVPRWTELTAKDYLERVHGNA